MQRYEPATAGEKVCSALNIAHSNQSNYGETTRTFQISVSPIAPPYWAGAFQHHGPVHERQTCDLAPRSTAAEECVARYTSPTANNSATPRRPEFLWISVSQITSPYWVGAFQHHGLVHERQTRDLVPRSTTAEECVARYTFPTANNPATPRRPESRWLSVSADHATVLGRRIPAPRTRPRASDSRPGSSINCGRRMCSALNIAHRNQSSCSTTTRISLAFDCRRSRHRFGLRHSAPRTRPRASDSQAGASINCGQQNV